MAQTSPDYKKLYFEEQRLRKKAEDDARQEQRLREESEKQTRQTTLLELLDGCHTHLYSGLTVQDPTMSTQGNPANAKDKLRPDRICFWEGFEEQQLAIWDVLMESDFIRERHFDNLSFLEGSGKRVQQRMMSSELDLHIFQRSTVEDHVSSVVKELYINERLRQEFQLKGDIMFENHANALRLDPLLEEGIQQMTVSETQRRRPPRIGAPQLDSSNSLNETGPTAEATARSTRPRADQFCVYNVPRGTMNTERTVAFVMEYKPPHKLSLGQIYEGLEDMELESVLQVSETDFQKTVCRRLVAAVITQAFSYMVQIGAAFGCVCTGSATIFLRVPEDPKTVYYYLSVPGSDVGDKTGWASNPEGENRLHLTAVAQMLAFTLQSLKTSPRSQTWRDRATSRLEKWGFVYEDLVDAIPKGQEAPSSEYRPSRSKKFHNLSPLKMQLRRRRARTSLSCEPPPDQIENDDREPDPDTPSRQQSSTHRSSAAHDASRKPSPDQNFDHDTGRGHGRNYCTQDCLRGLVEGGLLDMSCPNVRNHGEKHHQIDRLAFITLIHQQLSKDRDTDCQQLGMWGSRGAMLKVSLTSHGYTVIVKGTCIELVKYLKHEAAIYAHLRPIQGTHIPVHLGNIDLDRPYYYDGITELSHMMLLGFGGNLISDQITAANGPLFVQQVKRSVQAIHALGVLHKDLEPRNILWNGETKAAMVIDFERAVFVGERTVLGVISPNRKRKRGSELKESLAKQSKDEPDFVREMDRTLNGLRGLT